MMAENAKRKEEQEKQERETQEKEEAWRKAPMSGKELLALRKKERLERAEREREERERVEREREEQERRQERERVECEERERARREMEERKRAEREERERERREREERAKREKEEVEREVRAEREREEREREERERAEEERERAEAERRVSRSWDPSKIRERYDKGEGGSDTGAGAIRQGRGTKIRERYDKGEGRGSSERSMEEDDSEVSSSTASIHVHSESEDAAPMRNVGRVDGSSRGEDSRTSIARRENTVSMTRREGADKAPGAASSDTHAIADMDALQDTHAPVGEAAKRAQRLSMSGKELLALRKKERLERAEREKEEREKERAALEREWLNSSAASQAEVWCEFYALRAGARPRSLLVSCCCVDARVLLLWGCGCGDAGMCARIPSITITTSSITTMRLVH
jgi:hypothetical protein